ncbi:MAG: tetratricopeptide repeat protein [Bryobacterales bacterium]|nr:tetratricopeptide repeat protein [Bryobacterales bacterium]
MKRAFRNLAALMWAALALGYSPLWAQKPKSPKESQALLAVQTAKTPDERIAAIEKVLTDFADTEFKVPLLQMAVQSEQQKGDYAQTVFYADRLLKADPKNAFALDTLASETARHTRENDLDRDEQLAKVEKWAKEAIEAAKVMPKPRPDIPEADWDGFKKDMEAQAYEAMGMADAVRKNYDGAANNYKEALAVGSTANPATLVRLAQVYMSTGKLDNAVFTLDKAINSPNVPEQVKSIAENMKNDIAKRRAAAGAAKPASPATSTSPTPASPGTPANPATPTPASPTPPANH